MTSLNKCNGICNVIDDCFAKTCVSSQRKDVHVKVFDMITRMNEVKTFLGHISCNFKCKSNSTTCNSDQK